MVEQRLLMDVLGKPFPALMQQLVLKPIGMTHSTFEQPLPTALQSQAASGHTGEGSMAPGRYFVFPEMAAAGLWTTPTDLLKWAMEVAAARAGKSTKVLSRQIATQMLTYQNEANGLGPALDGTGRGFYFGHGGLNRPGFSSELIYFPDTGQGAVVMINGGRGLIIREILTSIATEYKWPNRGMLVLEPIAMDTVEMDRYVGRFAAAGSSVEVTREGRQLFVRSPSNRTDEAVLLARDKFVILWSGQEATITFDSTGRAQALRLFGSVYERQ